MDDGAAVKRKGEQRSDNEESMIKMVMVVAVVPTPKAHTHAHRQTLEER